MTYYVYILANATNVAVYIGVTNDLIRRVYEHKHDFSENSFTAKHGIHKLVYYEQTGDVRAALEREKQLKGWVRRKKNHLVSQKNPEWRDLYPDLLG